MKRFAFLVLSVILLGCTGLQKGVDPVATSKSIGEIEAFLEDHPGAKISSQYLTKEKALTQLNKAPGCELVDAQALYLVTFKDDLFTAVAFIGVNQEPLCIVTTNGPTPTPSPIPQPTFIPTPTIPVTPTTEETECVRESRQTAYPAQCYPGTCPRGLSPVSLSCTSSSGVVAGVCCHSGFPPKPSPSPTPVASPTPTPAPQTCTQNRDCPAGSACVMVCPDCARGVTGCDGSCRGTCEAVSSPTPTPLPTATPTPLPTPLPVCYPYESAVDAVWAGQQKYWADQLDAQLGVENPYVLYDLELATASVLQEATYCNNTRRLDELARLYLRAYPYMNVTESGSRKWLCGPGCSEFNHPSYTNHEVELVSTQFVHALSLTSRQIARIQASQRTPTMVDFLDKYLPVIVNDHLRPWVFDDRRWEVRGWGCGFANGPLILDDFNHREFTERKLARSLGDRPGYCNGVTDHDLWIYASVAEMFGAQKSDPSAFSQRGLVMAPFKPYLQDANRLLQSRLTPSYVTDFAGRPVQGLNFDLGVWDSHVEYAYTNYTGASFPSPSDAGKAKNVGWDISHAYRFVPVFYSLYANRDATGSTFPTRETIAGLANQLVYGAFNHDFHKPLFSNFMDGTNGWYRVDFAGRSNFGYGPYSISDAVAYGGYGFWSEFNPDVRRVLQSVYDLLFVKLKAADASGNQNHGVSFALTDVSPRGRAARFRVPTDLVMVPNSESLENLQEFTMEVRVKPASVNRSTYTVLSRGVNGNAPYVWWVLDLRPAENTTWVELGDSNGQYRATSRPLDWQADREYFLSFSWSNRLKSWVMTRDGIVVGNGTLSGDLHSSDHPIRVGSYSDTESTYFDGWIDELRIFNRVVDSAELSDHFAGRFSNDAGLAGYWNFDAAYDADLMDHAKRYYSKFLAPRWMLTFWPTFAAPISSSRSGIVPLPSAVPPPS